jgi:hypothetical protein
MWETSRRGNCWRGEETGEDLLVRLDEHIAGCEENLEVVQFEWLPWNTPSARDTTDEGNVAHDIRREEVGSVPSVLHPHREVRCTYIALPRPCRRAEQTSLLSQHRQ